MNGHDAFRTSEVAKAAPGVNVNQKRRQFTAQTGAIVGAGGAAGAAIGGAGRGLRVARRGVAGAALVTGAAGAAGANLVHRRVHGTNAKPTGRTDEPKTMRGLLRPKS